MNIYLTLKTINLQTVRHHELPDCYDFHITVGDGDTLIWAFRIIYMLINKFSLTFHSLIKSLFHIQIRFDNRAHSGKIKVDVENDVRIYECRDWNVEGTCKFYPNPFSSQPLIYTVLWPSQTKIFILIIASKASRGQHSDIILVAEWLLQENTTACLSFVEFSGNKKKLLM